MESKQELKFILTNVNDWLKYAEAKHAGLIALNAAFIFGVLSNQQNIIKFSYLPIIVSSVICSCISIIVSIISQFPVTDNALFLKKDIENPNLYFFGHIANLDVDKYIFEIKRNIEFEESIFDKNIINQIIINSKIVSLKLLLFKIASYIICFGLGIFILSLIISGLCRL